MVGASGFEPPTSWSRTRRASQAALRPEGVKREEPVYLGTAGTAIRVKTLAGTVRRNKWAAAPESILGEGAFAASVAERGLLVQNSIYTAVRFIVSVAG